MYNFIFFIIFLFVTLNFVTPVHAGRVDVFFDWKLGYSFVSSRPEGSESNGNQYSYAIDAGDGYAIGLTRDNLSLSYFDIKYNGDIVTYRNDIAIPGETLASIYGWNIRYDVFYQKSINVYIAANIYNYEYADDEKSYKIFYFDDFDTIIGISINALRYIEPYVEVYNFRLERLGFGVRFNLYKFT